MPSRGINYILLIFFFQCQASSEHPLGKAILQYARHFHFFDESSPVSGTKNDAGEFKSGWLYDVSDFSALPGRGVQCFLDGKRILVNCAKSFIMCKSYFPESCLFEAVYLLLGLRAIFVI